jgi:DNA-binding NarL/FixJ family response regulator
VAVAVTALCWVVALIVARQGTGGTRTAAAVAMGASAAVAATWGSLERQRFRRPTRIVRGLVRQLDRVGADRALRALSLLEGDAARRIDGTSPELAGLHVTRAVAQLPSGRVLEGATRTALRFRMVALISAVCVLGIAFLETWRLVEGADVLLARHGRAPVTMRWLEGLDVTTRPPDYLREPEAHVLALFSLPLPYGTVITVRGVPVRPGRNLLLSDGTAEVPFVEDGAGALVARWTLTRSASLHVVARFGAVAIAEPDALIAESIPDAPPTVTLEGAPRRLLLAEQNEGDIPIRYEAADDHGLREVQLVLRSGTREERRVLAHLDGETKQDRGGSLLRLRDPFIKKSHAPVEVVVEAKDNDPLTGPKWSASAAITLVPADVGEPEARRLDALRRLRDAFVDALAWRLSHGVPDDSTARNAFIEEERRLAAADDAVFTHTLTQAYAGIRVSPRIRAPLVAEQRKNRQALDSESKGPSAETHARVVQATEQLVLVADALVRGQGLHDSRESAHELADVADDLAAGASLAREESVEAGPRGAARMNAARDVLSSGGNVMKRLGALGHDLGEIVEADLLRVNRARAALDLIHAELAARDLAARLREPDPSFGSRGGSMGRAGGESGGALGSSGERSGSPDDVEEAFQEAAKGVEQLAQDHAGEVARTEQALAEATSAEDLEQVRREARRHAAAIREATRELPSIGRGSDSWTSKGATSRELAEQMARSLERGGIEDAVQSGRGSLGALDEAKRMLQRGSLLEDPSGEQRRRVEDIRRSLDAEHKWAERQLEQMRKRAAERARKELQQGGDEEGKLADRARDLAQQGRDRGSLPQQVVESIEDAERAARQAAGALRQGDVEQGLDRQREAQRALEAANGQLHSEDEGASNASAPDREGDSKAVSNSGEVRLEPNKQNGAEEFRKRVVRGLGQPSSGALRDVVRRYAEGLLR